MALAGTTACSSVLGVGTATATSSWGCSVALRTSPGDAFGPGAVRQAPPEVHPFVASSLLAVRGMSTTVRNRCNSACRIPAWKGPKGGVRPRALLNGPSLGVRPGTPQTGGAMEASGNRIDAGNVIGQAFQTYQNYAAPLLGGAVLVVGITSVIDIILGLTGSIILVFAGLIIGLIGQVL